MVKDSRVYSIGSHCGKSVTVEVINPDVTDDITVKW